MPTPKLRQQIAFEAARRMLEHQESFHRAKFRAAQQLTGGWVHPRALPSHREIRAELERLAAARLACDDRLLAAAPPDDRFAAYAALLAPLEEVRQSPERHPEGDALYHSLQVFDLACDELPYDEEFLLAALLHDVGKAIDPRDHVTAGLAALEGLITERTAWLIGSHPLAHAWLDGRLGQRARRRLEEAEHFEDLLVLGRCDRAGRRAGIEASEVDDALAYIAHLEAENET